MTPVAPLTAAALADMTWPEADARRDAILAVPLGATEQHGPHLPLSTDTVVAEALVRSLAARRPDVVIAPTLPYGSSGEHAAFPGTLSLGGAALTTVVVELVRSADHFAGTVLVSGHGGNAEALAGAVRLLRGEGRRAVAWWPRPAVLPGDPDAHAGRTETSLVLALAPAAVRTAAAAAGERRPVRDVAAELRSGGVALVSPNGVLGDPAGASDDEGRRVLAALVADLAATVAAEWGEG